MKCLVCFAYFYNEKICMQLYFSIKKLTKTYNLQLKMWEKHMSHLIRKVKLFKLTKKTMNILSTYKDLIFGSFMNIRSELLY